MAYISFTVTISENNVKAECSDNSVTLAESLVLNPLVSRFFRKIKSAFKTDDVVDVDTDDLITFGEALYQSFFPGKICIKLDSLVEHLKQDEHVRVCLHIEPSHISVYPCEFLYHPEQKYFLCRNKKITLCRYTPLSQPYQPLSVNPPLRALLIVCNPADTARGRFKDDLYLKAVKEVLAAVKIESKLLYNPSVAEVKKEVETGSIIPPKN